MAKILVLAEIMICFGPATMLLLIAPVLLPIQFEALKEEPLRWEGTFLVMGSLVGGIAGLCALVLVVSRLFAQAEIARPLPVLLATLFGVAAIVGMGIGEGAPALVLQVMPLAATAHILFLSRRLFVPLVKANVQPSVWSWIWLAVPAVLALSAATVAVRADQSRQELLDRKARWEHVRPKAYSFESNFGGAPLASSVGPPRKIVVQGENIESAVYLFVPTPGIPTSDPPPALHAWTMDRIFDELLKAKERGAHVRARYNETWGFVESADVNFDQLDASWSLTVKSFEQVAPNGYTPDEVQPFRFRDRFH